MIDIYYKFFVHKLHDIYILHRADIPNSEHALNSGQNN